MYLEEYGIQVTISHFEPYRTTLEKANEIARTNWENFNFTWLEENGVHIKDSWRINVFQYGKRVHWTQVYSYPLRKVDIKHGFKYLESRVTG